MPRLLPDYREAFLFLLISSFFILFATRKIGNSVCCERFMILIDDTEPASLHWQQEPSKNSCLLPFRSLQSVQSAGSLEQRVPRFFPTLLLEKRRGSGRLRGLLDDPSNVLNNPGGYPIVSSYIRVIGSREIDDIRLHPPHHWGPVKTPDVAGLHTAARTVSRVAHMRGKNGILLQNITSSVSERLSMSHLLAI
jgi:hypothetical protein